MNKTELLKVLTELEISRGAYDLDGKSRPDCLTLKPLRNHVWQVFYTEPWGIRTPLYLFDTEEEACKFMLKSFLEHADYYQDPKVKKYYEEMCSDPKYEEICKKFNLK